MDPVFIEDFLATLGECADDVGEVGMLSMPISDWLPKSHPDKLPEPPPPPMAAVMAEWLFLDRDGLKPLSMSRDFKLKCYKQCFLQGLLQLISIFLDLCLIPGDKATFSYWF